MRPPLTERDDEDATYDAWRAQQDLDEDHESREGNE